MQKTIFITGASSGLGKASAKLFQRNGWKVIATMRKPENEVELSQLENISLLPLDVTNVEQINHTVNELIKNHSIDVVLNNAGYGLIGPLEAFSDEQITKQIDTNLLGVLRVTKAFTSHFREKRNGVFINITSSFGLVGFPTCSVYSATKFAVDGFSESLAHELDQFNIQVKVVAPGGIKTDFVTRSMDGANHDAYKELIAKVSEGYSAEQIENYAKAEDIAQVIFDAATDGKDQFRYVAGKDAIALYEERNLIGTEEQVRKTKITFKQN